MENQPDRDVLAPLREAALLREHRFTSRVPLAGGLIAAFRRAWNSVSTRWYVAPLMQQQTEFNQMTVQRLAEVMERLERQAEQLATLERTLAEMTDLLIPLGTGLPRLQEWLIEQDREQTELRHDLGELALRVRQLSHAGGTGDQSIGPSGRSPAPDTSA